MPATTRGFTLVELLITLALFGILCSLAVPGLANLQQNQQLRSASQSLWSHLMLARSEAVKRGVPVLVAAVGGQWSSGWRVFPDRNGNGLQDADEPLLQQHAALAEGVLAKGNTPVRRYIRYTPDGRSKLLGGAFQAGTLSLCHSNGEHPVRQLVISATGRVRFAQAAPGPC